MTATETTATDLAGYLAGTWDIDPVHSDVSFSVRHMMVSKVRGHFRAFTGEIVTADDPTQSRVAATFDLSSIETGNEQRDNHLRSSDFFAVEANPTMTFTSTGIRRQGDGFVVDGDLSLHGVTKQVPLKLELNGFGPDPMGGTRAGFSATATLNRSDFGITYNAAIEGGGVVVGDKVDVSLEIEAVLRQPAG